MIFCSSFAALEVPCDVRNRERDFDTKVLMKVNIVIMVTMIALAALKLVKRILFDGGEGSGDDDEGAGDADVIINCYLANAASD